MNKFLLKIASMRIESAQEKKVKSGKGKLEKSVDNADERIELPWQALGRSNPARAGEI